MLDRRTILPDRTAPVREPMSMIEACREARVPIEAHLFAECGHGFGPLYISPDKPGARRPELFDRWMSRTLAAPKPA